MHGALSFLRLFYDQHTRILCFNCPSRLMTSHIERLHSGAVLWVNLCFGCGARQMVLMISVCTFVKFDLQLPFHLIFFASADVSISFDQKLSRDRDKSRLSVILAKIFSRLPSVPSLKFLVRARMCALHPAKFPGRSSFDSVKRTNGLP